MSVPGASARLTADHEIPARAPLRVRAGKTVRVGDRDAEWPAFVLVRAEGGEGWVPSRHLDGARPEARVVEAYDTTELPARSGVVVEIVADDDASGWAWCRDAAGREGWVPHRVLHVL
ncbi:SH3 domain-containing protein [Microbacterium betulae]|uniref:SH3 domain-containing protein n=1 Tax=Microbacterium betulae TaxID=2981139 RepID=A0AA97FHM2_9MICO|nr:SH3 domain-containing protein [Microbacterium sp. AB]WOF23053.1 SH3 domain-containing protein [Microbacterium sp. AB]